MCISEKLFILKVIIIVIKGTAIVTQQNDQHENSNNLLKPGLYEVLPNFDVIILDGKSSPAYYVLNDKVQNYALTNDPINTYEYTSPNKNNLNYLVPISKISQGSVSGEKKVVINYYDVNNTFKNRLLKAIHNFNFPFQMKQVSNKTEHRSEISPKNNTESTNPLINGIPRNIPFQKMTAISNRERKKSSNRKISGKNTSGKQTTSDKGNVSGVKFHVRFDKNIISDPKLMDVTRDLNVPKKNDKDVMHVVFNKCNFTKLEINNIDTLRELDKELQKHLKNSNKKKTKPEVLLDGKYTDKKEAISEPDEHEKSLIFNNTKKVVVNYLNTTEKSSAKIGYHSPVANAKKATNKPIALKPKNEKVKITESRNLVEDLSKEQASQDELRSSRQEKQKEMKDKDLANFNFIVRPKTKSLMDEILETLQHQSINKRKGIKLQNGFKSGGHGKEIYYTDPNKNTILANINDPNLKEILYLTRHSANEVTSQLKSETGYENSSSEIYSKNEVDMNNEETKDISNAKYDADVQVPNVSNNELNQQNTVYSTLNDGNEAQGLNNNDNELSNGTDLKDDASIMGFENVETTKVLSLENSNNFPVEHCVHVVAVPALNGTAVKQANQIYEFELSANTERNTDNSSLVENNVANTSDSEQMISPSIPENNSKPILISYEPSYSANTDWAEKFGEKLQHCHKVMAIPRSKHFLVNKHNIGIQHYHNNEPEREVHIRRNILNSNENGSNFIEQSSVLENKYDLPKYSLPSENISYKSLYKE